MIQKFSLLIWLKLQLVFVRLRLWLITFFITGCASHQVPVVPVVQKAMTHIDAASEISDRIDAKAVIIQQYWK
jgi:hypothetical protein